MTKIGLKIYLLIVTNKHWFEAFVALAIAFKLFEIGS